MIILEKVERLIQKNHPNALCDDCIAEQLDLSVRQHANHKTRELALSHKYNRQVGQCICCGKAKKVIKYIHSISN